MRRAMFRYGGYKLGKIRVTDTGGEREMMLDEAIEHAKEVARTCNDDQCAADHIQLADWLRQARGADKAARWYMSKIQELEAENEKLKNLVRDLHACNGSCLRCLELMGKCEYEEQLGELGIGVLDE